jgi:hypothetical protein
LKIKTPKYEQSFNRPIGRQPANRSAAKTARATNIVLMGTLNILECFAEKPALHLPPLKMNKTNVNIFLVLLMFPLTRMWHFFGATKVSYWLQDGFVYPIEEYWYFEYLSEHLAWIIFSVLVVRLAKMRKWLEITAIVHLVYRLYDLGAFLYNFNREYDYVVAYSFSGLITAIVYFFRNEVYRLKLMQRLFRKKII